MPLINDLTRANLKQFGLEPFGISLPALSKQWINIPGSDISSAITLDENNLSISSSAPWMMPISAMGRKVDTSDLAINVTLTKADGSCMNEAGLFFELFPHAYLRLQKLYSLKFETAGTHNPLRTTGISIRPVPKYFFIANSSIPTDVHGGFIVAGGNTEISGELRFFDEQGFIIHPLAVASAFNALAGIYAGLVKTSSPDQLTGIIGLHPDSFLVRYVTPDGNPYTGENIEGASAVNTATGLFSANDFSGTDSTIHSQLTRTADTGTTGVFPAVQARHFHFGLTTYGRMDGTINIPKANVAVTLSHEFYTVQVVDTRTYLTGTPDPDYNGSKIEPKPVVRLHENIELQADGNSLMRQLQLVADGAATESLIVGTELDTRFPLPLTGDRYWPLFPPVTEGITADDATFPSNLKEQLTHYSKAEVITGTADIQLTLTGLPLDSTVRVYTRQFTPDARILRLTGPGGIAATEVSPPVAPASPSRKFNGECALRLKNPLHLTPPITFSPNPSLIVDVCIVQRSGKKRIIGGIEIPINTGGVPPSAEPTENAAVSISKKGVSKAAILGLHSTSVSFIPTTSFNDFINKILELSGETPPRDAPRLPTMARRDLIAAALRGGSWNALISGGGVGTYLHDASPFLGSPGSRGGKHAIHTSLQTGGACLAYDLARMAFRRTTSFNDRIQSLTNSNWNEPSVNTILPAGDSPTSSRGTISGAVLQNISPYCEMPELSLIKEFLSDSEIAGIPADWNALVDWTVAKINDISLSGLSGLLNTAVTSLKTELVNRLNALKDTDPLHESRNERLYAELLREVSSSCYGRRDSQWAIENAIKKARNFIYIETPGFSATEYSPGDNYSRNLTNLLADRIAACPGLKVIICVPKMPDYGKGYEGFAAREVQDRLDLILALPAKNVVAFHPYGFPGVDSNIETNAIIVDDQWALLGSSSFRRRGLTFDGSSDLVFTELERVRGASPKIKAFRKSIFAARLGIDPTDESDTRHVMINDATKAFNYIREMLIDGGLGKIDRLWNGHTEGVPFVAPVYDRKLVNPDGIEFNLLETSIFSVLSGLAT